MAKLSTSWSAPAYWFVLGTLLSNRLAKHIWWPGAYLAGHRVDYLAFRISLTELWLGLGLIFWFTRPDVRQKCLGQLARLAKQPLIWLFLVWWCWWLSQQPLAWTTHLSWWIPWTLWVWYAVNFSWPEKSLLLGLVAGSLLSVGLSLYQVSTGHSLGSWAWWWGEPVLSANQPLIAKISWQGRLYLRAYGSFAHPNAQAGFLLVTSLLWLWLGKQTCIGRSIWARYLILAGLLLGLLLTGSHTAWLATVVSLVWWRYSQGLVKLLPALLAVFWIYPLVWLGWPEYLDLPSNPEWQERWLLLQASLQLFQQHWWTGVGWQGFLPALSLIRHSSGLPLQPVHHAGYLLLVQLGLPGMAWLAWIGYRMARKINFACPATAMFVGIIITAATDHYWLSLLPNWRLLWIVGVLVWLHCRKSNHHAEMDFQKH